MTDDESTNVSPGLILMWRCSPLMIFMRPAFDSPCAPVERIITLSSLYLLTSSTEMSVPSFALTKPSALRDLDVRLHGVAVQRHFAAELLGDLDDLRDAGDERGERGDDDAALRGPEYLLEVLFNGLFRNASGPVFSAFVLSTMKVCTPILPMLSNSSRPCGCLRRRNPGGSRRSGRCCRSASS